MPIRTKRQDNSLYETQVTETEGVIATLSGGSTAYYLEIRPKIGLIWKPYKQKLE